MNNREAHFYLEELQRMMTQHRGIFSEEFVCANGMAILALEQERKEGAVEVVRCRDCKHWERGTIDEQDNFISPKCAIQTSTHDARHADDFCSWAERKERKQ